MPNEKINPKNFKAMPKSVTVDTFMGERMARQRIAGPVRSKASQNSMVYPEGRLHTLSTMKTRL